MDWFFWRLIVEHVATLPELERYWSLMDVVDANAALDVYSEARQA